MLGGSTNILRVCYKSLPAIGGRLKFYSFIFLLWGYHELCNIQEENTKQKNLGLQKTTKGPALRQDTHLHISPGEALWTDKFGDGLL